MIDERELQLLIEKIITDDRDVERRGYDSAKQVAEQIMTFVELYTDDCFIKK